MWCVQHPDHGVSGRLFSGEWKEGVKWDMEDGGSDDSGMDTILDGEDDEEPQTEQKQGMYSPHYSVYRTEAGSLPLCDCGECVFAETMEKISALESELARLKAQIAVYALSEVSNIPTGTCTCPQFVVRQRYNVHACM